MWVKFYNYLMALRQWRNVAEHTGYTWAGEAGCLLEFSGCYTQKGKLWVLE